MSSLFRFIFNGPLLDNLTLFFLAETVGGGLLPGGSVRGVLGS